MEKKHACLAYICCAYDKPLKGQENKTICMHILGGTVRLWKGKDDLRDLGDLACPQECPQMVSSHHFMVILSSKDLEQIIMILRCSDGGCQFVLCTRRRLLGKVGSH